MTAVVDALWRALALLALAVAPYAAPAGVPPASSVVVVVLRALAVLAFAAGAVIALRWLTVRSRVAAATCVASLAVAVALGVFLPYTRWPLTRAVWFVAPFVWASVALAAGAFVDAFAGERGSRGVRVGASVGALVLGAAGLAVAAPRLASRRVVLAANPGFEPIAVDEAQALARSGQTAAARDVLAKCVEANRDACDCLAGALPSALAARDYAGVLAWTERASPRCVRPAQSLGARAEALAETGRADDAGKTADAALASGDRDAHAAYAKALVAASQGKTDQAIRFARQAEGWGRGPDAAVLLGRALAQSGDLEGAERELTAASASDPTNVAALLALASLAEQRHQYHRAREGYLRVLAVDHDAIEARYRLAVMTHAIGADAEARHHVDEMAKIAPSDPRIPPLRSILAASAAPKE